jgi:hypothetical protein
MPALKNPRWEAFAQAIVKGLASDKPNGKNTAKAAYLAAGYSSTSDRSAIVNASRLMTKVDSVVQRIRELQAQALARVDRKLDISRERIGRRLDLASRMAEEQQNPMAIATNELGIAKVFGLAKAHDQYDPTDLDNAQSAEQLAVLLLQSVGLDPPFTAQEIESATVANDVFVVALEHIKEQRHLSG